MTFSIIFAVIAASLAINSYKKYKKFKEDFLFLPKKEFEKKYGKIKMKKI